MSERKHEDQTAAADAMFRETAAFLMWCRDNHVTFDATDEGLYIRKRDQGTPTLKGDPRIQRLGGAIFFLTEWAIEIERGHARADAMGFEREIVDGLISLLWTRKQARLSRTAKKKTTCDVCGELFRMKQPGSEHVHFTDQIDQLTGTRASSNEWMDFCSPACKARAQRESACGTVHPVAGEKERLIEDLLSGSRQVH